MNQEAVLAAPAKINWMLRVLGRRPDGYHDIETIFQTISLSDELRLRRAERFSFRCDDPTIPAGAENLVVRAARMMTEKFSLPAVGVQLTKRIPAGGGLGGGSSDAAAAIRGLIALFDIRAEASDLHQIALSLGSDTPFFLLGGVAYGTGRGEILRPLPRAPAIPLLLALPAPRVSTAEAYQWLDEARHRNAAVGFDKAATIASDLFGQSQELTNDFEPVVFERFPMLAALRKKMLQAGAAWCRMSGSGSAIVGAFRDQAARDRAAGELGGLVRTVIAETVPGES